MLFSVPGLMSSDGFPAMVTRPDLEGCLNCLWLPFVATIYHPSDVIKSIMSFTFIGMIYNRLSMIVCKSFFRNHGIFILKIWIIKISNCFQWSEFWKYGKPEAEIITCLLSENISLISKEYNYLLSRFVARNPSLGASYGLKNSGNK